MWKGGDGGLTVFLPVFSPDDVIFSFCIYIFPFYFFFSPYILIQDSNFDLYSELLL